MDTNSILIIVLAVVAVIAIGIAIYSYSRYQRIRHLRQHFGPEYERLAQETGSAELARKELEAREKRVQKFNIRALTAEEQARFRAAWLPVQAEFVDNPKTALAHADELLGKVMAVCGYPVEDFEQRAADLSVEHPLVVQHYHAAHAIALRHKEGEANTEELRQAMIHYRALFDDLVSPGPTAHAAE